MQRGGHTLPGGRQETEAAPGKRERVLWRRKSEASPAGPMHVCMLSCVWLFVTSRTVACQASLYMGLFGQESWSGLPFPSPGDDPGPGVKPTFPASPTLAGRFFNTAHHLWSPCLGLETREFQKRKDDSFKELRGRVMVTVPGSPGYQQSCSWPLTPRRSPQYESL